MFRKMPFILILVIIAIVFLDSLIPFSVKQFLYAMALSIKSIIIFLLPFIIFCLLFKAAIMLSKNATRIIGLVLIFICCSNFLSTFLAHFVGSWIHHFDLSLLTPQEEASSLVPLWIFALPKLVENSHAMFAGIISGILVGYLAPHAVAATIAKQLEGWVEVLLKAFVYIIPFFVAGFVIKLQYDDVVTTIFKEYTLIFLFVCLAQFTYIFVVYFLLSHCKVKEFIRLVRNMLPAMIGGFSTMSSAATMPLTLMGAENNAKNKEIANAVVPITVNVHLTGDCFAITIFAYAVLKSFGMDEPSLMAYLIFALYFVLAKFSVAGVPGGGILVMLPILEAHLGFTPEMLSIMTGLYILFDPVITSANVLGNGAFAKMVDNFTHWMNSFKKKDNSVSS